MAIQPLPAHGTLNWDMPLNAILRQIGNAWYPSDHNLLSWTVDPSAVTGGAPTVSNTTVYMIGVPLRQAATVSTIYMSVTAMGVTLTAGQNFAGLYDSAGTRVGITADQSTTWNSTGLKAMALTTPASVVAGIYYVAFVANGATAPSFAVEANLSASVMGVGLTAATARSATFAGSFTTLPTSITPASRSLGAASWWAAVA